VFPADGLVLLRGRGKAPLVIERLPALGPVAAFARVGLVEGEAAVGQPAGQPQAQSVAVPLRLAPDPQPWRNVTASLVHPAQLGVLRQLAYRLGRRALEETTIAFTQLGAFLLRPQGIEGVPVGDFFVQVHPQIFVSAGCSPVPAVSPEVLFTALGSPARELVFLHRDGRRLGIAREAFVTLERALLEATSWTGLSTENVVSALSTPLPQVSLESPGFRPLRDVPDEGQSRSGAPPAGTGG